jgi:SAM-dependent methyltransferase
MPEIDLMRALPKPKRNVGARNAARTPERIRLSRRFGYDYFDGSRDTGYGGYRYDGRWVPVARDILAHWKLGPGSRVLDVGCAKGFLVKDLVDACPGLEVWGIDISAYAIAHCEPEVAGRLVRGTCELLPFRDGSFDAVIAKDVIHNQTRDGCVQSLCEIQRVSGGRAFVQVDAYRCEAERQAFLDWVLTARHHDYPEGWLALFADAGYTGDYFWTIT